MPNLFRNLVAMFGCLAAVVAPALDARTSDRAKSLDQLKKINVHTVDIKTFAEGMEGKPHDDSDADFKVGDVAVDWAKLKPELEASGLPISWIRRPETPRTVELGSASLKMFAALGEKFTPGPHRPVLTVSLRQKLQEVEASFLDYHQAYQAALREPSQDRQILAATSDTLSANVVAALSEASRTNVSTSDGMLGTLLALEQMRAIEAKSVSGPRSNYKVSRYEAVVENAAVVGRIDVGARSTASCILIGNHLVATAAHAVRQLGRDDFCVSFFDAKGNRYQYRRVANVVVDPPMTVAGIDTTLDLAIFSIELLKPGPDVVASQPPADLYSGNLSLDEGVYLLGYPEPKDVGFGTLTVHDACFAIYPHRIAADSVDPMVVRAVRQRLYSDLNLAQGVADFRPISDDVIRAAIANQQELLNEIYPVATGGTARYYVRLPLTTNPARVPVFGLDADASEGDSGGGVFSKDRGGNALVGVFVSGVAGADTIYTAQLMRHEHAIPASVVVQLLRASFPAAIAQYQIKFQSPNDPVR